jgi:putative ABC transport system permease protein
VFFAFLISLLAGAMTGLPPVIRATAGDVYPVLKEEGTRAGFGRSRARNFLVAAQVALSALLLIVAGLFVRSLGNASRMDLGFDSRSALAMDFDVEARGWPEEKQRKFYGDLLARVRVLPGVQGVSLADLAPLDLATRRTGILVDGRALPPGQDALFVSSSVVSPDYFNTLRIPLLAGRAFSDRDTAGSPDVAIVNETMARTYWPAGAVGQRFRLAAQPRAPRVIEIVGVARDAKYRSLGEAREPHFYLPHGQHHNASRTLLVRVAGDPAAAIAVLQRETGRLDPDVQGFFARTLVQHTAFALVPARVAAALSAAFGLLALLLASLGLYGVLAYAVAQRTHEIGVRMALGAQPRDVLRLVALQGLQCAGAGLLAGLGGAMVVGQLLARFFYGVSPTDAAIYGAVAGLLLAVVFVACYIPARRATRVDPLVALRYE